MDDSHIDALGDSVQDVQHVVNENSTEENILGDSRTDAAEDTIQQRLPVLEPHPVTDLSDDCITIEEVHHTGKHNPITIWVRKPRLLFMIIYKS